MALLTTTVLAVLATLLAGDGLWLVSRTGVPVVEAAGVLLTELVSKSSVCRRVLPGFAFVDPEALSVPRPFRTIVPFRVSMDIVEAS